MKKIFFVCLTVLAFSSAAYASGLYLSPKELVKDSDLIVVGTLRFVSEYKVNYHDYGEGRILIAEVIFDNTQTGDVSPLKAGDEIRLKWSNPPIVCPRVEHKQNENQEGIWLLKVEDDGTVRADYQDRFVSADKLGEIKKLLRNRGKSGKVSKIVAVEKIEAPPFQPPTSGEINLPVQAAAAVDKPVQTNRFSLTGASTAAAVSLALYWLLYRSRFRIR